MQTHASEASRSESSAESAILDELTRTPVPATVLRRRVCGRIPGLSDKQCKLALDALVAARKIHARPRLAKKTGKPTKTIESYAVGEPPPPPPAPRERAPEEVLALLAFGPVGADVLKARVRERLPQLSVKEYGEVLAELVRDAKIHGRRKRGKDGKPLKSIESYALGGLPANDFIAPVIELWDQQRAEAKAAGVDERALNTALLEALSARGISVQLGSNTESAANDRDDVLRSLQTLVAREGRGALIPISKLRNTNQLPKPRLDAAVLALYAEDAIILHHHDYVGSLSESEREQLVVDRHGNHYVGIALRGDA